MAKNILKYLEGMFKKKPLSEHAKYERIIKKMGYRSQGENRFEKETNIAMNVIWIMPAGIKFKVYVNGYAESDFYSYPIKNEESLIEFIRLNEA
jgi:hypothetical protein